MEQNKPLILVVDDVEQNVAVISQILRNQGYNVMAAFSGETALRMVQKRLPNLIMLDIMMPGLNGFDVCRSLKSQESTKNIPVIFLSALTETDTKIQGFEAGGVDYITKPFQESEVIARAKVHLTIRQLELEREEYIRRLTEMNDEKDRLMQVVSHDLRSPLGGIKGLAEIMRDSEENLAQEDISEYANIIVNTSDMLLGLINDLLDLAKIESGKMNLNESSFNIADTIANSVELAKILAEKKGIQLAVEIQQKNIMVCADEPKITQVVNNLLSNALKFTNINGTVTLRCLISGEDHNELEISVQDTGIGIPEENIPILFEKFGRHQRMGTEGERGTGLGLPIVKRFVELHHGVTEVQSVPGEGTTFTIRLPILIQEPRSQEKSTVAA